MVPLKPAFCALLLALLGSAPGWVPPRSCRVPEVLRHYHAIIFEDLQAAVQQVRPGAQLTGPSSRQHFIQKNMTGAGGEQGWRGASCSAQKEHSILLSIESLGRTLRRAVSGGRRSALEKTAWTVAVRTEAVMRHHCWTSHQSLRPKMHLVLRRGSRRRLLLRTLDTIATCWEKLFALRATATRES